MNQPRFNNKVRDYGSAKEGVHHWWMQRVSSVALIPLGLWTAYSLLTLQNFFHETVRKWMAEPINATLMIVTIIIVYYHLALGVRVILEDYIHTDWLKFASIISLNITSFILCLASVIAILKMFL